jgi:hypothetical protein
MLIDIAYVALGILGIMGFVLTIAALDTRDKEHLKFFLICDIVLLCLGGFIWAAHGEVVTTTTQFVVDSTKEGIPYILDGGEILPIQKHFNRSLEPGDVIVKSVSERKFSGFFYGAPGKPEWSLKGSQGSQENEE